VSAARLNQRTSVFLDRDGTIIREHGHFWEPRLIELVPRAADAIRRLKGAGFLIIVTTNQSAIARGIFDEHQFWIGQRRVEELLAEQGIKLDAVYFCPHHPTEGDTPYKQECDCRKPKPGMILRAAREYGINLQRSFMVGDSPVDVGAGNAAGVRVVQVQTAYGKGIQGLVRSQAVEGTDGRPMEPDFKAEGIDEASHWILQQAARPAAR
jgi:D-glycero-D-manno-heptose 1,7-bisphosphate phosphatase